METLGDRIEEALKNSGMQQRELAMRVGITDSAMSRYISGERQPKPNVIANIATALHVTSDYLLGIETITVNGKHLERLIAREAQDMSAEEKNELIKLILGAE